MNVAKFSENIESLYLPKEIKRGALFSFVFAVEPFAHFESFILGEISKAILKFDNFIRD